MVWLVSSTPIKIRDYINGEELEYHRSFREDQAR